MRERVKRFFSDFERAYLNLKSATESASDELSIDGTIKRFELCYELAWKLIKEYLADLGIIRKNPRDCFKEAFNQGFIEDQMAWMEMIEDRNLLVHTYTSEESRVIFEKIKCVYVKLFEKLYDELKELK